MMKEETLMPMVVPRRRGGAEIWIVPVLDALTIEQDNDLSSGCIMVRVTLKSPVYSGDPID